MRRGARVTEFFFKKNLNLKKKKIHFHLCRGWRGGGGGGGGVAGWRGRGARVSDFFLLRIQISNIFFGGGGGGGKRE